MTDIEQKALALVNEIERQEGLSDLTPRIMRGLVMDEALCRAIEQHEAFRQKVSEAVQDYIDHYRQEGWLGFDHFIIPKPDPLVELSDTIGVHRISLEQALAKHGLKLERIEHE